MEDVAKIAKIFKALCDENRVSILKLLQDGERCACNIADELALSQSKLSYHMKILCESGIVECWYVSKWTHYRISPTGSEAAIAILREITTTTAGADDNCACTQKAI